MKSKGKRTLKRDGSRYDRWFPAPDYRKVLTNREIKAVITVDTVKEVVARSYKQVAKLAQFVGSTPDPLRTLWHFIYDNIQYTNDREGEEEVREPARIWADRIRGVDCDDYTVFISAVLTNLRINHVLRVTAYKRDWQHIYVIVPNKTNANLEKRLDYTVLDDVTDDFDYEVPYSKKMDYPITFDTNMPTFVLSGLDDQQTGELGLFRRRARNLAQQQVAKGQVAPIQKTQSNPDDDLVKEWQPAKRRSWFGKALQKVSRGALKVVGAPVRNAVLAAMKLNIMGLAAKLKYGYLPADVALKKFGLQRPQWAKVRNQLMKFQNTFVKAGGEAVNFKKAILKGKGNNDKAVPFSGLGELGAAERQTWEREIEYLHGLDGLSGTELGFEPTTSVVVTVILPLLKLAVSALKDINPQPQGEEGSTNIPTNQSGEVTSGFMGIGELGKANAKRKAKKALQKLTPEQKAALKAKLKANRKNRKKKASGIPVIANDNGQSPSNTVPPVQSQEAKPKIGAKVLDVLKDPTFKEVVSTGVSLLKKKKKAKPTTTDTEEQAANTGIKPPNSAGYGYDTEQSYQQQPTQSMLPAVAERAESVTAEPVGPEVRYMDKGGNSLPIQEPASTGSSWLPIAIGAAALGGFVMLSGSRNNGSDRKGSLSGTKQKAKRKVKRKAKPDISANAKLR